MEQKKLNKILGKYAEQAKTTLDINSEFASITNYLEKRIEKIAESALVRCLFNIQLRYDFLKRQYGEKNVRVGNDKLRGNPIIYVDFKKSIVEEEFDIDFDFDGITLKKYVQRIKKGE